MHPGSTKLPLVVLSHVSKIARMAHVPGVVVQPIDVEVVVSSTGNRVAAEVRAPSADHDQLSVLPIERYGHALAQVLAQVRHDALISKCQGIEFEYTLSVCHLPTFTTVIDLSQRVTMPP